MHFGSTVPGKIKKVKLGGREGGISVFPGSVLPKLNRNTAHKMEVLSPEKLKR
jgi:hypothetical protein